MACIPRDGIKEIMGINNSISDTHKIVVNPPKGRVRNGMRIVQRSWDTYNRGFIPVFMPEWCEYASRNVYRQYTQCTQMLNDSKYALSGGRHPARYTRCLFQYGYSTSTNGKPHCVCPKAKGGVYKGYVTAKIIRDCTMRFNYNIIDDVYKIDILKADPVESRWKIMAIYAESLTITLSNYDLSGRPWRTAIR